MNSKKAYISFGNKPIYLGKLNTLNFFLLPICLITSIAKTVILNDQLDAMIENKYTFYNYNGLTRSRFAELTNNFETNIFDNSVVIIDEAHNFISLIVNKINKMT